MAVHCRILQTVGKKRCGFTNWLSQLGPQCGAYSWDYQSHCYFPGSGNVVTIQMNGALQKEAIKSNYLPLQN